MKSWSKRELALAVLVIPVVELVKFIQRRRAR